MKQVKDFERLLDTMMDAKQKSRQEQKSQTEKENKSSGIVQKDRKRLKMDTHQKDYDEKIQQSHSIEMSLPPAPTISSKSLKRIRKHQEYMQKIKDREELEQLDYIVTKTKKYTPPSDSDIDDFMKKLQACSNPRDQEYKKQSMEFEDFVVIESEHKKEKEQEQEHEQKSEQKKEQEPVFNSESDSDDEFIEPCFTCGDYQHATYQCSTYKTKMCWYQLRHKNQRNQPPCRVKKCIFAHDESELRTPPSIHFIQEQEE